MKWKVKTDMKTYVISAHSSNEAVKIVNTTYGDRSQIQGVSIEPNNTLGKVKRFWRDNFGK